MVKGGEFIATINGKLMTYEKNNRSMASS